MLIGGTYRRRPVPLPFIDSLGFGSRVVRPKLKVSPSPRPASVACPPITRKRMPAPPARPAMTVKSFDACTHAEN